MGKIYADDELSKIVFSDNETLKALQKKKISLQKKSVQLVDEKLYDINKKSEIMKNIKDNEFGQIL